MFAHNNEQIDYGLMALCNALMIKNNSREKSVALVTDEGTHEWLHKSHGTLVSKAFDQIILNKSPSHNTQKRRFNDTQYSNFELPWYNETRASVYEQSPFSETVLIDCDYLICDNSLDQVWGDTLTPVRMNRRALTLNHEAVSDTETRLEPFTIPMYWATCVYFKKGDFAKTFFNMVEVIRENYQYYQYLYRFPGRIFRNDYAFSIAAHILGGWVEDYIDPLPNNIIMTSFDNDDLLDVPAKNELMFLVQDSKETWKYRPSRVKNISTHVMNKFSLIRNASKIIELYGDI